MHDPQTVAHEIKYPWYRHKPWPKKYRHLEGWDKRHAWEKRMGEDEKLGCDSFWDEGYRDTFITIWHVDPERDGTDDSCGYSYVKLTRKQKNILHNAAWHESRHPHFLAWREKEFSGTVAECESLYRGLVLLVCRVLRIKITFDQAAKYATEATHIRDVPKFGGAFCFLPGYHTNSEKDSEENRRQHFEGILAGVARNILTQRRPWYRHPKWHFWHWRFQCQPLILFKRWAFSRCSKCGGRFSWGYSPVTNSWNSTGPRWFRSEKDTFHSDCYQMKTTMETVVICEIGDVKVMVQASGAGIAIIKDKENKDAFTNHWYYIDLMQAGYIVDCLTRAMKEYHSNPKRESTA